MKIAAGTPRRECERSIAPRGLPRMGAGAVVARDVQPRRVLLGVPARVARDVD